MRLWLTPQEIAEEQLPGLPTSKRNVNAHAERHGWRGYSTHARRRPGAEGGGGWEYHIDLLPAWARLAYLRHHVEIAAAETAPAADLGVRSEDARDEGQHVAKIGDTAAVQRDARLAIVRMADRMRESSGLSTIAADTAFAALYSGGSMPCPAWVRAAVGAVSARSLARWRSATAAGRSDALAIDRAAARRGTGVLDRAEGGAVRAHCLALLAKNPLLTAKHVRTSVTDRFEGLSNVPLRTFQHALKGWKKEYRHELTRLTDPDRFRSSVRLVATGSTRADRLNQVWQIDASPADVMTTDGRQSVYVAIDVFSRRLAVLVTGTPRAEGVGLLLRKCMLAWGVPETIKSDNGSDFVARWTLRLLAALGIEHDPSAPFSPEQKGIVERAIGTFQRDFCRTLPGFIGHNVADRKRIEAKMAFSQRLGADEETLFGVDLSAAELQRYADDWADTAYAHAPHAGLKGRTPFEAAAAWIGSVRRIEDASALDMLLARVPGKDGIRRVTRQGIRIDGTHYLVGNIMPGEDVLCRFDPADLGRLHLFTADGETFLGHALAPELAGLDPAETIARVRAEQKAILDGRLADIRREARRIRPRDVADAMHREAAEKAGKLIAFRRPVEVHETPSIAAASAATTEPGSTPLTGRAAEIHRELIAEAAMPRPVITQLRPTDTPQIRFRRALELETRIAAGGELDQQDALWLGGYRAGSEYRAMRIVFEDFGEAAIR